jgi:elongation factor 2
MSKNIIDIHEAMNNSTNVRSFSISSSVDAGKSTLADALLNRAGFISSDQTGDKRYMDSRKDEQERCITIKSSGISLYYTYDDEDLPTSSNGNKFLLNLIDTPGHVDFSSEVTAALRVTDGNLIIIDAIAGIATQVETVLRQALDEMIYPVCFINKLDLLILTLQLEEEDFYQKLLLHVNNLNATIYKHNHKLPEINLTPEDGTVAFGSGLMGWGFTLKTFAKRWETKMGIPYKTLIKYLWGDNYYERKTNTWHTQPGKNRVRGFTYCITRPIMIIFKTIMNNRDACYTDNDTIKSLVDGLKIALPEKHRETMGYN